MASTMAWGVLSPAGIAVNKVIPGMLKSPGVRLAAIASRDAGRARAAADRFGVAKAYGSYEELLADPEIGAVYNPLPNHLHVPWSVAALRAGKHVLCEKPIALTAAEAADLVTVRDETGRQVLEAFMVRQHPQWLRVRDLVRDGAIGDVRLVQTTLSYFNVDPANVRNKADIGGGALYDIGCYAVLLSRFVFGAEPRRAVSLVDRDPDMGTDRLTSGLVDFGEGRRLAFSTATQLVRAQRMEIFGTTGRIEVPVALNAPQDGTTTILVDIGGAIDGSGIRSETLPACDQYMLQAETAMRVFRGEEAAEFPIEDAVANMRVVDALYRSGANGSWQDV
ncbi:Gfo/Idh/MocA family protein [Prosthecomicrobium sp. N25]|uniref:Gfo/Idh/MocA family protein n=1 Tax=Prosthecomicrobium sp. N25 TaxID=3129254 RepID=UPI0030786993